MMTSPFFGLSHCLKTGVTNKLIKTKYKIANEIFNFLKLDFPCPIYQIEHIGGHILTTSLGFYCKSSKHLIGGSVIRIT